MRGRLPILLLTSFTCLSGFGEDAGQSLSVSFEPALATIPPRAADRPIQLPELIFSLQAKAQCGATESGASVSISVADSRISFVAADKDTVDQELRVPGKQLGPVVASAFCLEDVPASAQRVELKGALSAQLSLRCKSENSETISYSTVPLDVTLECLAAE